MEAELTLRALAKLRVEEALREVGVLLVAFAPLDMAFSDAQRKLPTGALFLGLGVVSFSLAVRLEHRRTHRA